MGRIMKLQSAMEYLMTYGWAILIIAVVMVALFALGVFGGGSSVSTACLPNSGYQCSSVIYSHSTGNVVLTVGQSTGNNWMNANVFFVPQGTGSLGGVPSFVAANVVNTYGAAIGSFTNNQATTITLGVSAPNGNAGATSSGAIWVSYQTQAGGSAYYTKLATINLKAV